MRRIKLRTLAAAAAMLATLSTAPGGPSLAATLDFIADKINAQGTFGYAETVTDTAGAENGG